MDRYVRAHLLRIFILNLYRSSLHSSPLHCINFQVTHKPPRNNIQMADEKESDTITIRVKDQGGDETFFKVKKTTKMQKVFGAYAQRKGVAITSLRFLIDGDRIDPAETPKSLELEDQDQSKCHLSHTPFTPLCLPVLLRTSSRKCTGSARRGRTSLSHFPSFFCYFSSYSHHF